MGMELCVCVCVCVADGYQKSVYIVCIYVRT